MSTLYTGSAAVLNDFLRAKTPLTALVYASPLLPDKQKKAAYALLMGTLRYKATLEEVLETSNFMSLDRKMNRSLVLLMLYDLLLSDSKSIAGGGVVKKLLMSHANHMRTALVRLKIAKGAHGDEDLLPREIRFTSKLPRYVRINTLRATPEQVHAALAADGYELASEQYDRTQHDWSVAGSNPKLYYPDAHIPHLLVFAPGTDLHDHALLSSGRIILQDKASCMPAASLDPANPAHGLDTPGQPWHVLDGCAAPGNKTTHLLAIAMEHLRKGMTNNSTTAAAAVPSDSSAAAAAASSSSAEAAPAAGGKHSKVRPPRRRSRAVTDDVDELDAALPFAKGGSKGRPQPTGQSVTFRIGQPGRPIQFKLEAFEVDPARFQLLHRMMARALPSPFVSSAPSPLPPSSDAHLVCPPCPAAEVVLHNRSFLDVSPSDPCFRSVRAVLLDPTCSGSGMMHRIEMYYKHKVDEGEQRAGKRNAAGTGAAKTKTNGASEKAEVVENIEALAAFQKEIVQHGLKFPNLQMLSYSTCSVHAAEDECVVSACLSSESGRAFSTSPALPSWFRRGAPHDSGLTEAQAAMCARVAGAEDGMNGFFVARFKRTDANTAAGMTQTDDKQGARGAATATAAAAASSTSPSPASAPSRGQKHARDATADEEDGAEDADGETAADDDATASAAGATPATGSQSRKNKKKREKAKLKRQKLAGAGTD